MNYASSVTSPLAFGCQKTLNGQIPHRLNTARHSIADIPQPPLTPPFRSFLFLCVASQFSIVSWGYCGRHTQPNAQEHGDISAQCARLTHLLLGEGVTRSFLSDSHVSLLALLPLSRSALLISFLVFSDDHKLFGQRLGHACTELASPRCGDRHPQTKCIPHMKESQQRQDQQ